MLRSRSTGVAAGRELPARFDEAQPEQRERDGHDDREQPARQRNVTRIVAELREAVDELRSCRRT